MLICSVILSTGLITNPFILKSIRQLINFNNVKYRSEYDLVMNLFHACIHFREIEMYGRIGVAV